MKIDKSFSHPIHPKHKLKLEFTDTPFKCDGCKEAGIGLEYRCRLCEFDLHKACAEAAPSFTHPFYKDCFFQFHYKPPGPDRRKCDACQNEVLGFVYHCKQCGFDLHPCCANLPKVLDGGDRNFYLCNKMGTACHCCGGKGAGWAYRSECKTYTLHVSCVKKLLVESWQEMYLNVGKKNMQMRIPSLKGTMKSHHHKGVRGNARKCCQMAGGAVRAIVSAILGDPTAIIAAVVWGFISK